MKRSSLWTIAASLAMTLFAASPARADAVGPPPDNCLDGSIGASCHGGPYCAPATCTTDADCEAGKVCKDTGLCTSTLDCGGLGGPYPVPEVTGICGEACPSGSTCTTQKVCVTPGGGAGGNGAGGNGAGGNAAGGDGVGASGNDVLVTGCACDLPGRSTTLGAAGALLLAAGVAGLGGRRRRRH